MQRGGWPKGAATSGTEVSFGSFGLKAVETGIVSARQIEAARRAMTRYIHRGGKVWIRIFPDKPITQKGAQSTMGKGKGSVDHYAVMVIAGKMLFEIDGVPKATAETALRLAAYKLSVKTKFIERHAE
jgi:large subunit ribosomal protein L16